MSLAGKQVALWLLPRFIRSLIFAASSHLSSSIFIAPTATFESESQTGIHCLDTGLGVAANPHVLDLFPALPAQ
ncbi:hypothetical protein C8J57DRAFT_1317798 [Mycena rebaudengoi]|nr:hypothetical protein C8J57DRAFT_1317798 [Mycena rebaudengoi]